MMICPRCQTENPETKKFCTECGGKLSLVCPHCQAEVRLTEKFCGECGQPLIQVPQVVMPPVTSTTPQPTSFANDRYQVKKFLGEGGKKKVYPGP